MIRSLMPVAALLLSVAILLTGQGLQGTLLPVRANLEQFSPSMIGFMGAAYFFGFTVGCIKGIAMIRQVGHIRVFAAMTAIASSTPLLHSLMINDFAWCMLRLLTGFCFATLYVVIESWLNEMSTNENRGTIFSVYVVIHLTVVAVGQQMLLLADPASMNLFAAITVLVSLAAVPVALSTSPMPKLVPVGAKIDLKKLYVISPAGVLGCIAGGVASGIFYSLSPLFTASVSDDITLAAWFMTAAVIGGAVGQWPLGFLSDRIDRRIVIAICATCCAALSVMMWSLAGDITEKMLLAIALAWGAFSFPIYSISIAHANDYADPEDFVMISSGTLLVYGLGAIASPFVASFLIRFFGAGGIFLVIAAVDSLLAIYIFYRMVRREKAAEEDHIPFTEALAAASTKSPVYDYVEDSEYAGENVSSAYTEWTETTDDDADGELADDVEDVDRADPDTPER